MSLAPLFRRKFSLSPLKSSFSSSARVNQKTFSSNCASNYFEDSTFNCWGIKSRRFQLNGLPTQRGTINFSLQRNIHSSSALSHPRFKLSLERQEPAKISEQEDNEEEEEESYLKSHPFRKLCTWRSKSELAKVLVENQIHNDHGLFVTNKPFGVGSRNPPKHKGGANQEQQIHVRGLQVSPYTLEDALPDLRILLDRPKLILINSTEKLTSGIAVFADDGEVSKNFSDALRASRRIFEPFFNYHVITVLPPVLPHRDPNKVVRVGLACKTPVGSDVPQPILLKQYSNNSVKRQEVRVIKVQTKILKPGYNAGFLVEINTGKVKNNLLRIHCADQLAPLLGDHLYSSRVRVLKGVACKIDPTHLSPGTSFQKLPEKMQELLELRKPEDSLMVPTHVHLRSFKVRKFLGKKIDMEFVAPYPPYFKWTCKQLGIQIVEELV